MSASQLVLEREEASAKPLDNPHRWGILGVCLALSFLTMLDVSIANVALPTIQRSLHAGSTSLQLMVAGYTLTFGLTLVPTGRLGDAGHRRQILLTGLIVFALASVASALASSDTMLACARLVQGAAAGALNPQGMGLIQQAFRREERGRAFGFNGAVIGISNTLGPVLGGIVISLAGTADGWRWVFGLSLPISLIILAFAWRLVPRTEQRPSERVSLDGMGLVLISIATLAVMMPFVTTTGVNDNPERWWWLVLGAAGTIALYFSERRVKHHGGSVIVDSAIVGERSFRNGTVLGMVYFAGLNSVMLIVTLLLQEGLGYTALHAGLVAAPFAVGSAVVAIRSGRLVGRYGRPLVVAGLAVACVGIAGAALVADLYSRGTSLPGGIGVWIALAMLIAGAGSGSVLSPNLTLTLQNVPVAQAGVGSSMMQVGQRLGSAVGLTVALSVYYSAIAAGHSASDAAHETLMITVGLFALALCVAIFDAVQRHRT